MHWCILDTLVQRVRTCHQRVEHIVSPSPPANPREGRQGSIGTAGAGLSYTACCKNGGYELPPYALEALGQPPEYSGFDGGAAVVQPAGRCALRMPPETPLDLRSSCRRAGFHRSPRSVDMSTLCSDQAGHREHSGRNHEAQRRRVGTTTPFTLSTHEHRLWLVGPHEANHAAASLAECYRCWSCLPYDDSCSA